MSNAFDVLSKARVLYGTNVANHPTLYVSGFDLVNPNELTLNEAESLDMIRWSDKDDPVLWLLCGWMMPYLKPANLLPVDGDDPVSGTWSVTTINGDEIAMVAIDDDTRGGFLSVGVFPLPDEPSDD